MVRCGPAHGVEGCGVWARMARVRLGYDLATVLNGGKGTIGFSKAKGFECIAQMDSMHRRNVATLDQGVVMLDPR